MTKLIKKALKLCEKVFDGVTDKAGAPYINHCGFVMSLAFKTAKDANVESVEDIAVAAALHDVVEDSNYTIEDIKNEYGAYIAAIVDNVTRRDGEKESEYKARVESDIGSVIVKYADATHNSDCGRFEDPTIYAEKCKKYGEYANKLYKLLCESM